MGVTTTSDLEGILDDPTPEEVKSFQKLEKGMLVSTCYSQLQSLREMQKLVKELKDAGCEDRITELKELKGIKRKYDVLVEEYEDLKVRNNSNAKKIATFNMLSNEAIAAKKALDESKQAV